MPKNQTQKYLTFDLETFGPDWRTHPIVGIAAAKHQPNGKTTYYKTWMLTPEQQTTVHKDGEKTLEIQTPRPEHETQAIIDFLDWMQPFEQPIYTYNSAVWDIPILYSRLGALQGKNHLPHHIRRIKNMETQIIDMMPIIAQLHPSNGSLPNTLTEACQLLGIQHEEYDDGDDVYQLFHDGRIQKLKKYLLNDLRMTGRLAHQIQNTEQENFLIR